MTKLSSSLLLPVGFLIVYYFPFYAKLLSNLGFSKSAASEPLNQASEEESYTEAQVNEILERVETTRIKRLASEKAESLRQKKSHSAPIAVEIDQVSLYLSESEWQISIFQLDFKIFDLRCKTTELERPSIQITELYNVNLLPEVLVSCPEIGPKIRYLHQIAFYNSVSKKWESIKASLDSPLTILPSSKDEKKSILYSVDPNFLGVFSDTKSSRPMRAYWEFTGTDLENVTKTAEGLFYLKKEKEEMEKLLTGTLESPNGFFPAYIAVKTMLGEKTDGWYKMLRGYDQKSKIGLRTYLCPPASKSDCKIPRDAYPEALKAFLESGGYL
jgi:hypothetical protein